MLLAYCNIHTNIDISIKVYFNLNGSAESGCIYLGIFFARCDFYAKGCFCKKGAKGGGSK